MKWKRMELLKKRRKTKKTRRQKMKIFCLKKPRSQLKVSESPPLGNFYWTWCPVHCTLSSPIASWRRRRALYPGVWPLLSSRPDLFFDLEQSCRFATLLSPGHLISTILRWLCFLKKQSRPPLLCLMRVRGMRRRWFRKTQRLAKLRSCLQCRLRPW